MIKLLKKFMFGNNKCKISVSFYFLQMQKCRFVRLKKDAFVVFLSSILIKNYFILCTLAEHFGLYFKTIFLKLYQHHVPIFGRHYILIEILEVYHCIRSTARLDLIMVLFCTFHHFLISYSILSCHLFYLSSFRFSQHNVTEFLINKNDMYIVLWIIVNNLHIPNKIICSYLLSI